MQPDFPAILINKTDEFLLPPSEGTSKGPHTSEYTTFSTSFPLCAILELKAFLGRLPIKQVSQTYMTKLRYTNNNFFIN